MNKGDFASSIVKKAVFVLSLDMELAWGFVLHPEHEVLSVLRKNPQKARETVDSLLSLCEKHGIKATWAIVGHLLLSPQEDTDSVLEQLPQFGEGCLDWDYYLSLRNQPLYRGRDLVEKILANRMHHDIGLHGFFHIPFDRCSREVAKAEIQAGIKAANTLGIQPKSFVFPQNRIAHIDVLKENGIRIYRGNNLRWWDQEIWPPIRKLDSAAHKFAVPSVLPLPKDGIWELPSSVFFCDPQMPFLLPWRARIGLQRAIRTKKIVHIWLHPWTLLLYDRLLKDLDNFLALVAQKRDEGKADVMTMGELASLLGR
jgi:peptidoglycan/xylan/chitin deacetylase (PgdA/CDA1 family)